MFSAKVTTDAALLHAFHTGQFRITTENPGVGNSELPHLYHNQIPNVPLAWLEEEINENGSFAPVIKTQPNGQLLILKIEDNDEKSPLAEFIAEHGVSKCYSNRTYELSTGDSPHNAEIGIDLRTAMFDKNDINSGYLAERLANRCRRAFEEIKGQTVSVVGEKRFLTGKEPESYTLTRDDQESVFVPYVPINTTLIFNELRNLFLSSNYNINRC